MMLNSKVYLKEGVNPETKILVLHGWNTGLKHIEPLSELLANLGEVHAVDLPGHGLSPVPESVWGMAEFADEIKSYLDKAGISKAILVGHSFGGKTIIKFMSLYPEYASKIVLIGASGIRPRPSIKKRIKFTALKLLRNFIRFKNTKLGMKIYQDWYIPKFASRDYLNAGPMTKTFVKTINEELHEELKAIKVPSLLIWGDLDDESPVSVGETMSQYIKDSRLIVMKSQGHFPYLGSGVGLLYRYIKEFIG